MADVETKKLASVVSSDLPVEVDNATDVVPVEDTCTPLPEDVNNRSKKRLREVSAEVSSPRDEKDVVEFPTKETDAPVKRNRLKTTDGSDEDVGEVAMPITPPSNTSPILSTSPPHDAKVRQIRRRVKDLSWKEGRRKSAGTTEPMPEDADQQDDGPETAEGGSDGKPEEDESSKSASVKSDSEKEEDAPKKDSSPPVDTGEDMSAEPTPTAEPVAGRLSPDPDACQGKRRREDADQNPREAKRITPPPEKEVDKEKPKAEAPPPAKPSGFLAYANSASPFASASGPSLFGGATSKPTFGSHTVPKVPLTSGFSSPAPRAAPSNAGTTTAVFGSAFSKYASSASPFAAAKPTNASPFAAASGSTSSGSKSPTRSKSPGRQHANAFEPYSKSSGKLGTLPSRPSKKQRRKTADTGELGTGSGSASGSGAEEESEEEPEKPATFGEILSAKDTEVVHESHEEKKIKLEAQEVVTGEEDEYTEYQVRAKLYESVRSAGTWQERGVGSLKLNINEKTDRARLVLRTDGVFRLILNAALFPGMKFELHTDPRYVRFAQVLDGTVIPCMLRFGSTKNADEFLKHIKLHIPSISSSSTLPQPEETV